MTSVPETMIKRVGLAVRKAADQLATRRLQYSDGDDYMRELTLVVGRAAIEAMRPLSPAIAKDLAQHFDNDITYGQVHSVRALWGDAIDAALAEDQP